MRRAAIIVGMLAAAALAGAGAAAAKTGQSPACSGYCVAVTPAEGPEGSVFTFEGRRWRPDRRVRVNFGLYCRPTVACPALLQTTLLRTDDKGRFSFRLRAGQPESGDERQGIRSASAPMFEQRSRHDRLITRTPRYRVILPAG